VGSVPDRRYAAPLVIGGLICVAAVSGCGGAGHRGGSSSGSSCSTVAASSASSSTTTAATVATICTARGLFAIERFLKAPSIATHGSMADSGYPQCLFTARLRSGGVVRVTVEVDVEPQAYAVLERTIEEAAQIFPQRLFAAPAQCAGWGSTPRGSRLSSTFSPPTPCDSSR